MGRHTSHDGKTTIDTKANTIEINGNQYDIDYDDGDYPVARSYTVDGIEGLVAKLMYEEGPASPREWADQFTTFATFGYICRDYATGDEQWDTEQRGDDFEAECPRCEGSGDDPEIFRLIRGQWTGTVVGKGSEAAMEALAELYDNDDTTYTVQEDYCAQCKGDASIRTDVITYIKRYKDAYLALGVYVDPGHGANNGWCRIDMPVDDSTNGVIFITKDEFDKEYTNHGGDSAQNRENALNFMRSQIEEYSKYLEGECYWHVIEDESNDLHESCGGYIGTEWAEEALYWEIASAIEDHHKEATERAEMAARDIITV